MTWQGGGGGGIPGVTSDGLTPGGEIIAGALTAGNPAAATAPNFHTVSGQTTFQDVPGTNVDGDNVVQIHQQAAVVSGNGYYGFDVVRSGSIAANDYQSPMVHVDDLTASTQPLAQFQKNDVTQFQVDSDGIQVHGKLKTGASATHTLGAYSGKSVPIYDEAGTLLGYTPLYA